MRDRHSITIGSTAEPECSRVRMELTVHVADDLLLRRVRLQSAAELDDAVAVRAYHPRAHQPHHLRASRVFTVRTGVHLLLPDDAVAVRAQHPRVHRRTACAYHLRIPVFMVRVSVLSVVTCRAHGL
jgi:hypothetical protein